MQNLLINPTSSLTRSACIFYGSRIWYLKYRFEGKESRVSFGSYPETSLALAREKRDATKRILKSGLNPSQQRRSEKVIVDESRTFQYIATL
ncbi:Arm DNA-binding domain-containing protein, partial [Salmonella enterica]